MPYFVKVGPFASNEGRPGARGYHIFRRGTTLFVVWGGILVRRGKYVSYAWSGTRYYRPYRLRTEAAAKAWREELIRTREEKEGYTRLGPGQRIQVTAKSRELVRKMKP